MRRIAAALERPSQALHLPAEVPPEYLKDLYYGNLEPDQQVNNQEIRQSTKKLIVLQEKLHQQLSPEDLALVEDLQRQLDLRSCEETASAFQIGFRTAMQMIVAGLSVPAENLDKGEDTND